MPGRIAGRARPRRGFSIAELLLALTIVSVVLTSALVAINAAFRGYKSTTDAASTHVVSRLMIHRMVAMIRTGEEFGPFPQDVLDPAQNPFESNFIEFLSDVDDATGDREVTRIEFRDADPDAGEQFGALWLTIFRFDVDGAPLGENEEYLVLPNIENAVFTLEYDVGPRLQRATIDLLIRPNDDLDATSVEERVETEPIRLVGSASPRRI
ncbi:MAG: prepilin-type N-terminal cleavage/methylation domain-containing protein [Planctomycetota bacterium]